jgi:crotonobetainyl-CoA:carnitine CoA-transferase CaiB-like acyl-CoA transferase
VALNLNDARAASIVRRLIDAADVVVENLGEARSRLGTGPEEACARRPKLVWCAITGLGADRGGRAIDPSLQAEMGMMASTGEPGGPPARVQAPTIDLMTGMYAVQRVLAALWQVERGGEGAFLDCAMLDAAATLTGPVALRAFAGTPPGRIGSESYLLVPSASFESSDGVYLQVIALTDDHWRGICRALEHPEWADDPRSEDNAARLANRELVHGWIREVIATGPAARWIKAIQEGGGMCVEVRDVEDAWSDPRLVERGLLAEIAAGGFEAFPVPVMSLARCADPASLPVGPRLGEHSAEVLGELGVAESELAALFADGTVVGS